jgi:hypothetical protein
LDPSINQASRLIAESAADSYWPHAALIARRAEGQGALRIGRRRTVARRGRRAVHSGQAARACERFVNYDRQ